MSLNVDRIALQRKAIQAFVLDDFPRLPEWFVRQFKLQEYEQQVEHWRRKSQESIRDAIQSIKIE